VVGVEVPIPILPFARILIFSVLLVINLKSLLSVVPKVARPAKALPLFTKAPKLPKLEFVSNNLTQLPAWA